MYKYILFILFAFNAYSQEKASIRFFPSDCRQKTEFGHYKYAPWTKKVSIKNNLGYNKTLAPKAGGERFEVKNLEKGTYTIIFENMFSQIVEMPFNVEEYKKYEVDLCTNIIDYSKEAFKPRISQLKNNEAFTINFYSQGCFHSDERELIISRKRKKYFLEYEGKSKRLSKKELKLVEHFEIELLFVKEDYCTTSDIYNIQFKDKNDFYIDGSCKWNGLYNLMESLGISNDKDY